MVFPAPSGLNGQPVVASRCETAAATRRPLETAREAAPWVLLPYTTAMDDDEGLPLSSPLPLSPPAVQAPIDNPDAPLSSESIEENVRTPASHNSPQLAYSAPPAPAAPPPDISVHSLCLAPLRCLRRQKGHLV